MKRTLLLLILALFVCSCQPENGPINDLKDLVEDLETNSSQYTAEDWDAVSVHYDAIMADMAQYKYSLEQQKEIAHLKSKVSDIITENSITIFQKKMKEGIDIFSDISTDLIQTADSLMSEFEN